MQHLRLGSLWWDLASNRKTPLIRRCPTKTPLMKGFIPHPRASTWQRFCHYSNTYTFSHSSSSVPTYVSSRVNTRISWRKPCLRSCVLGSQRVPIAEVISYLPSSGMSGSRASQTEREKFLHNLINQACMYICLVSRLYSLLPPLNYPAPKLRSSIPLKRSSTILHSNQISTKKNTPEHSPKPNSNPSTCAKSSGRFPASDRLASRRHVAPRPTKTPLMKDFIPRPPRGREK